MTGFTQQFSRQMYFYSNFSLHCINSGTNVRWYNILYRYFSRTVYPVFSRALYYRLVLYRIVSCLILLWRVVSCRVMSCHMSSRVMSCHVSCRVMSQTIVLGTLESAIIRSRLHFPLCFKSRLYNSFQVWPFYLFLHWYFSSVVDNCRTTWVFEQHSSLSLDVFFFL